MNRTESSVSPSPLSASSSPWDNVRRIYRGICVLRATGRTEDATGIEHGELLQALATARLTAPDAVDEPALLAEEADRVANANLLAELLAPLIAAKIPGAGASSGEPVSAKTSGAARPAATVTSAAPSVPNITDLIDGMLAQDKSLARSRRS